MVLQVQPIRQLSSICLDALLRDSQNSGFRAVQRLVDEWTSRKNRFERSGEVLFIARWHDCIVGVCGLTLDPYATVVHAGRVRRLYVMQSHRRQGVGRALVERVITEACPNFEWLHVRTDSLIADRFYRSLGFTPCCNNCYVTHSLNLSTLLSRTISTFKPDNSMSESERQTEH